MTTEELGRLFNEYNGKYFGNSICGYKVVAYKHLKSRLGQCDGVKKLIQVDETLDDVASRETLLHEMVHSFVGNENGHNKLFNAECERIEKLTGLNLRRYRLSEDEKTAINSKAYQYLAMYRQEALKYGRTERHNREVRDFYKRRLIKKEQMEELLIN